MEPGNFYIYIYIYTKRNNILDYLTRFDGFSMASPHVAGIAASLMSKQSFKSAAEVYEALKSAATNGALTFADPDNTNNHNLLAYNAGYSS